MKSLGEDVCELLRCADPNQTQMSILYGLMSKVVADSDVDVLRTISDPNDVVALFNAYIVVLVDQGPGLGSKTHILQERSEINHFNSRS